MILTVWILTGGQKVRKKELFSCIGQATEAAVAGRKNQLATAVGNFLRAYEQEGNEDGPLPEWVKRDVVVQAEDFMRILKLYRREQSVEETVRIWTAAQADFCNEVLSLLYPDAPHQKARMLAATA